MYSDGMLPDMLIGGIAGGISSLFGWAAGIGAAGSSAVRWLGTRIPWLARAFPKIFGGGVAAGVDQSLWDLLKEGKVNWKNALIAGGLGFVLVFGGEYAGVKIFKKCFAYEQPSNSYLAVMFPKLDCFFSPDRGGGSGSGNSLANQVKYVALRKSDIKHFSKHIVSSFSKQAPYLSDDVLKAKLDKNSFFNPNWSTEKIIAEVEKGYNEALQKGITEEYIYTTGGEQITIFIHPDGKFATAYGSHKLDMSYFGR